MVYIIIRWTWQPVSGLLYAPVVLQTSALDHRCVIIGVATAFHSGHQYRYVAIAQLLMITVDIRFDRICKQLNSFHVVEVKLQLRTT